MSIKFRVLLSSLLLLIGAVKIYSQKNQSLTHFNQIHMFGKMEVRLERSNQDSISVESASFDVNKVQVEVKDGILNLKLTSEFPSHIKVKATIFYTELKHIEAGGGIKFYNKGKLEQSFISIEAGSGSEFDLLVAFDSSKVSVNKGAFVRLTGTCRILHLKTSTGGDYRATALETDTAWVKMFGGTAELDVKTYLEADVRFGASLKYKAEPEKIVKTEKLGGTIMLLDEF